MNEFRFQVRVEDSTREAMLRFARRSQIERYYRSLSVSESESSESIQDALEFTRLAAKRWRYYSRHTEAAESFEDLLSKIRRSSTCEVAFIMVATVRQGRRDLPVGLAYCRRTWCHHLALDFLALHPRALDRRFHVSGVGSGIMFGLVRLAKAMRIPRIWGEATVHSAGFYEKLLAVQPIRDLFIIETPEMTAILERQTRQTD